MTIKNVPSQGSNGFQKKPVWDFLEVLEQAVAGGWYPARRGIISRLVSVI